VYSFIKMAVRRAGELAWRRKSDGGAAEDTTAAKPRPPRGVMRALDEDRTNTSNVNSSGVRQWWSLLNRYALVAA
jgi:hypothetical protein